MVPRSGVAAALTIFVALSTPSETLAFEEKRTEAAVIVTPILATLAGAIAGSVVLTQAGTDRSGATTQGDPATGGALLGIALLFGPSTGRWIGGDVSGALKKTGTRTLIVLPGLALAGLLGAVAGGDSRNADTALGAAKALGIATAGVVLIHGAYDVATTLADLTASVGWIPPAGGPQIVSFGGLERVSENAFGFGCGGGSGGSGDGTALTTGALVGYRLESVQLGILVQQSFGHASKSCAPVRYDFRVTRGYLEVGHAFEIGPLALTPHLDAGAVQILAFPRVLQSFVGQNFGVRSSLGTGGRLGLAAEWKFTAFLLAGADVSADVILYPNGATTAQTVAARVAIVF